MNTIDFTLRGDYISLDSLLKAAGIADSGGMAKQIITGGAVLLDGETELRRSRKIRAGSTVQIGDVRIAVHAESKE